jgi:hypothetical protein
MNHYLVILDESDISQSDSGDPYLFDDPDSALVLTPEQEYIDLHNPTSWTVPTTQNLGFFVFFSNVPFFPCPPFPRSRFPSSHFLSFPLPPLPLLHLP